MGGNSSPARGLNHLALTVIAVEWACLTLPIALVALTLVSFCVSIIDTSLGDRGRYQETSSTILLLTGVAGEVSDQFQDLRYLQEVEKDGKSIDSMTVADSAKQSRVQMKQMGQGLWRLVKV